MTWVSSRVVLLTRVSSSVSFLLTSSNALPIKQLFYNKHNARPRPDKHAVD